MKYSTEGTKQVVKICRLAQKRSEKGIKLWRTTRNYSKMYMTDMLQGLVDEGIKIWPVHIQRGWFEIDNLKDLSVAEKDLPSLNENEQGIFAIQEGIVIEEINNQRHNPGPKRSEKN
jgi:NDP-sugar pyrophosphorylase family protein